MVSASSGANEDDHPELAPSLLLPTIGAGLRGGLVVIGESVDLAACCSLPWLYLRFRDLSFSNYKKGNRQEGFIHMTNFEQLQSSERNSDVTFQILFVSKDTLGAKQFSTQTSFV